MPGINGIGPNDSTRRMNYIQQRQSNNPQEQQNIADESPNRQPSSSNQEALSQQLASMAAVNAANISNNTFGDNIAQQLSAYITHPISSESQARISTTARSVTSGMNEAMRLGFPPEQASQLVDTTMGRLI